MVLSAAIVHTADTTRCTVAPQYHATQPCTRSGEPWEPGPKPSSSGEPTETWPSDPHMDAGERDRANARHSTIRPCRSSSGLVCSPGPMDAGANAASGVGNQQRRMIGPMQERWGRRPRERPTDHDAMLQAVHHPYLLRAVPVRDRADASFMSGNQQSGDSVWEATDRQVRVRRGHGAMIKR